MQAARFNGGRHNNSFNASGISLIVIENLNQLADTSRRVNSGVRHASRKQDSSGLRDEAQNNRGSVECYNQWAV
jgi:hypothetical protein